MDYLDQDVSNCSIARAVAVVGQPWTLLVLRELLRGVRRFEQLQGHLGVSRSVLAKRLDAMVADGLITRRAYRDPGQRTRFEYDFTPRGRDLYPVITALRQWGDHHLADPAGPATTVEHAGCGAAVGVQVVCEHGHVLTGPGEAEPSPGPGARALATAPS